MSDFNKKLSEVIDILLNIGFVIAVISLMVITICAVIGAVASCSHYPF